MLILKGVKEYQVPTSRIFSASAKHENVVKLLFSRNLTTSQIESLLVSIVKKRS